jgi:propionyl-CoA carboxylase alpha chain
VHPGYGFLSENAAFARACAAAGLVFIGPPPEAIEAMGSKIAARSRMQKAGVPVVPGSDGSTQDLAALAKIAAQIGYPVLVKASAGGGGKGMRVVESAAEFERAAGLARSEAENSFGDGAIYLEKYLVQPRHIEFQVFGDAHGNIVHLFERECSIQRRHQKIVEETPSPAVDAALREELCQAAIAAARAVSYVGAGTVEFILTPGGEFFFLEMNTRLQVEHPVTECVVGVDLVRLQLLVAEGGALPFNGPPPLRGHAIEVRLYAEDPAYAWLPCTGTLHRFDVPGVGHTFGPLPAPGLRLDSGVADGSVVGVYYDPMLAKLIAWAPTRYEAARMLSTALARSHIHGVTTNRDLLVRVLRHTAFLSGGTDTAFLDRHPEVFAPLLSSVDAVRLSCLAAALAGAASRRSTSLPSGWRNVPSGLQTIAYDGPTGSLEVGYRLDRTGALAAWSVRRVEHEDVGLPGTAFDLAGSIEDHPPVALVSSSSSEVVLDVAGVRLSFSVHQVDDTSFVDSSEGSVALTALARYPLPVAEQLEGSLTAPLPGAVGRVLVVPGQRVAAGDLLLTVEAMKLEHPVHAPTDGVISDLRVAAGSQVETGTLLAVLTSD